MLPSKWRTSGLLIAAFLCSSPVDAQTVTIPDNCVPDPAHHEEARALFISGSSAVEAGRWADGIEVFQRAYTLSCSGSALYNLAISLRGLGRHREARDMFDRLLSAHPDMPDELRTLATQHRREEAGRVAAVELMGLAPDLRPDITFDGRPVPDSGQRPIVVEADRGDHSLVARIPEHQPFLWDGYLADGQRQGIHIEFEELPTSGGDLGPVVAIIVSVIVAGLIGGGIAVGYVLQQDAQLQPLNPNRTHEVQ